MSTSSSNGTGGTETLEPRSCPPCPRFRKSEGQQHFPTRLSEPGISRLEGCASSLPRDPKKHFRRQLKAEAEREQTVSGG